MGSSVNGASGGAMNCLRQFGRLYTLPRSSSFSSSLCLRLLRSSCPVSWHVFVKLLTIHDFRNRDSKEATKDLAVAAAAAAAPSIRVKVVQEAAAAARPSLHHGTVLKAAAVGSATATWAAASSSRGVVAKEATGPPTQTAP